MNKNYWTKFWNEDDIISSEHPQNQIGRTIHKVPITEEVWHYTLAFIASNLQINSEDVVLDLCAGNGLISLPFSKKCKAVTSVDISAVLIEKIKLQNCLNIETIVADVKEVDFEENSYSKIIIYFALQYFTEQETLLLFEKAFKWLRPGGKLFVGDVPDSSKLWSFFDTYERKKAYFDSLKNNEPIIGTWFNSEFLSNAASFTGFKDSSVIIQPKQLINHYYRFDIIMTK